MAQLYCGVRKKGEVETFPEVEDERIDHYQHKPKTGGMWTSTYTPNDEYCSEWIAWCDHEEYCSLGDFHHCYVIKPKKEARIYEIDSCEDLERLVDKYWGKKLPPKFSFFGAPLIFDKIKKDYDAIHLTERGQCRTRHSEPLSLYGWDVESTLWLRPMFEEISDLPPKGRLRRCKV